MNPDQTPQNEVEILIELIGTPVKGENEGRDTFILLACIGLGGMILWDVATHFWYLEWNGMTVEGIVISKHETISERCRNRRSAFGDITKLIRSLADEARSVRATRCKKVKKHFVRVQTSRRSFRVADSGAKLQVGDAVTLRHSFVDFHYASIQSTFSRLLWYLLQMAMSAAFFAKVWQLIYAHFGKSERAP